VEIPGQFVKTNFDSPYYLVKVGFQSQPYVYERFPGNSYTFITQHHDGLVHVPVPPEDYDAWITLVPMGVETRNPLVFRSEDYYSVMTDSIENGYFLEYEFETSGDIAHLPAEYDFPNTYSPDDDRGENELPGWFTENLPFLMPLIDPILPHIPNGLVPIVPYVVIAIPVILLLIAAGAIRSRGKRKTDSEEATN
jgi:hypothetical protein